MKTMALLFESFSIDMIYSVGYINNNCTVTIEYQRVLQSTFPLGMHQGFRKGENYCGKFSLLQCTTCYQCCLPLNYHYETNEIRQHDDAATNLTCNPTVKKIEDILSHRLQLEQITGGVRSTVAKDMSINIWYIKQTEGLFTSEWKGRMKCSRGNLQCILADSEWERKVFLEYFCFKFYTPHNKQTF